MITEKIIEFFLSKGYLLSPDFIDNLPPNFNLDEFYDNFVKKVKGKPSIINNDLFLIINNVDQFLEITWDEFEKSRVLFEKNKNKMMYNSFLDVMNYNLDEEKKAVLFEIEESEILEEEIIELRDYARVVVVKSYKDNPKKWEINDFVQYFKKRYISLKNILISRGELKNTSSINKILLKTEKESVSIIGFVMEKEFTKNGNLMLTLEDPTATIKVLINKGKEDLFSLAEDIVLDEVIGINGVTGNKILFCNEVFFPDIPVTHELKKTPDEVYAAFISDIQIGMKLCLYDKLLLFIKWLQGDYGNSEQREIASKIRYLFVVGDVVEGIGIYPKQEEDLEIMNIYDQYKKAAEIFSLVPSHIKIIMCGGNHDAMRLAEPQPVFDKEIAKPLYDLSNIEIVSNPSLVNIHSSNAFPGIDVLLYHGYSFFYYASEVSSLRAAGGVNRTDLIMRFLLKKRHLSPTHTSNLYIPDFRDDFMVIDKVPDIFVSGHTHKLSYGSYRNVTLLNSSCWAAETENQVRFGLVPDPCKVPIVNLKTREVKIMNFDVAGDGI
ncbi:metallophosphoesterase [Candidatus Woesearchaeota archaeon]|nr:metallophosphoesterase [Candidatus Woesearchaeota archaeon]